MIIRKCLLYATGLLLSGTLCMAQNIRGKGAFQLDIDFARFYADSEVTYLEMYYGIHENSLAYRKDSSGLSGGVNMKWEILTDSARTAFKEWTVPHTMADSTSIRASQTLMGKQALGLSPGDYNVSVVTYDFNDPARRDSFTTLLRIGRYPRGREALSDIEFCTSIQSSENKQSIFYKNTLEVIPNASRLYGAGLPIMYYYAEAYNLKDRPDESNMTVRTSVIDALGKEVITKDKQKPRLHNSSVEVGTVNLSALKGGTYLFRISLVDTARGVLAYSEKKFFVYRPVSGISDSGGADRSRPDVMGSRYAVMTEEDIDRAFDYARYTATDAERHQYEKFTSLDAKRKFLYEFWQRRDIDPQTPANETEETYYKRVDYARDNFTSGNREGWKADRGRIYIVFGPPDEIERFPSSSESNPYEIWHYNNIQGGVIFVFVDRVGLSDYILVHSTHRSELRNEDWYAQYAQRMR